MGLAEQMPLFEQDSQLGAHVDKATCRQVPLPFMLLLGVCVWV